jgi:ribosomal protein S18 acetylase RimI-like enzyme
MDAETLLDAAAQNLAGWHDCSVGALGFAASRGDWWWASPTPGPWIYFTAISLRRPHSHTDTMAMVAELRRHLDDPAGSFEAVCDSAGMLDLAPLGLTRRMAGLWYARPAGPLPRDDDPEELTVGPVRSAAELEAFEQATCAAFDSPPPVAPFEIHAPGILDDPAMHVLLGWVDDEVVGGAMAYLTDRVLGIYGVGTVPGHRGRGYATALTRACLALDPTRPATLQPSVAAAALYRRLGFIEMGRFTHWG